MAKTLEQSFERLEEIIAQMEKSDTINKNRITN